MYYIHDGELIEMKRSDLAEADRKTLRKLSAEFSYRGEEALMSARDLLSSIPPKNRKAVLAMARA